MAGKELKVIITAQDGASRVFSEVGSSAQEAGNSVERAGQQGKAGMDSLSQSASQASQSLNEAARAATVVGGVITGAFAAPMLAGAKAAWGQVDAVEQATVAFRALEPDVAAVNTVLAELIEYARSDLGRLFSRQELFAAAQGLKVMGAETENLTRYVEIMGRSVSMGAGTWDELGQVIGRVGSTGQLTGVEFDNLTKMGYQLDASLRNTTVTWDELFNILDQGMAQVEGQSETIQGQLTMTETAVRSLGLAFLQVDSETSQFIEGGLGDRMVSGLAQVRELLSALEPLAAAAGSAFATLAGVASDMAYAFSSLPDWLQTGILGFTALGGVATLAAGSLALIIPRIASTALAVRGLGAAFTTAIASIGPVGWAIIGVGAAIGAGMALWGRHRAAVDEARSAYEALHGAIASVDDLVRSTRLQGDALNAIRMDAVVQATRAGIDEWRAVLSQGEQVWGDFVDSIYGDQDFAREFTQSDFFEGVVNEYQKMSGVSQEIIDEMLAGNLDVIEGHLPGLAEAMSQYYQTYMPTDSDVAEIETALHSMLELMMNPEIDSSALLTKWNEGISQFITEAEHPDLQGFLTYWSGVETEIVESIDGISTALDGLSEAQRAFNLEMAQLRLDGDGKLADDLETINSLLGDQSQLSEEAGVYVDFFIKNVENGTIALGEYEHELFVLREMYKSGAIDQETYELGLIDIALRSAEATAATRALTEAMSSMGDEVNAIAAEGIEEYNRRLEEMIDLYGRLLDVAGYGDPLSRWNLAGNATDMSMLAMETQHAATALDTVYRVAVGNTDAVGRQVQGIHDWAEALIGVQGEWSELDRLVNEGRITGKSGEFGVDSEYADAQRAYNSILEDNAAIQDHILTIQAKQSPLIAEHVAMLEEQYGLIADMPAEQALIALGWMDSTTAMRAMEFQTLAVAAATGQLGENGEEVFTNMIVGAAQADPVLKALLIDMGLIEEGADGTITVNLEGAEGARSEMSMLTEAIVNLIDLFDDGVINGSFVLDAEDNASPIIRTARQNLDDADGDSATMELHLNDYATAGINAASWALSALDGAVASTTIRTIYENRGIGPSKALGGVVQEYASGGVVIRAGEVGPEIAHFANGGTALLPRDGLYSVPSGSYITPNHAVSNYSGDTVFNITVNGGDADQIKRVFTDEIVPGLTRAVGDRRVGMGAS